MTAHTPELAGPDLTAGIPFESLKDGGMVAGHAHGEAVLLARVGEEVFAVGAICSHYGGPLADGVIVGDTVRCPWHHACFSLRTGEAWRAPALRPVSCWQVVRNGNSVAVADKLPEPRQESPHEPLADTGTKDWDTPPGSISGNLSGSVSDIVIVGAGAAGDAAADMLRRRGYRGSIVLIGADPAAPYDRPNISKDYLAGNAPEEWLPLRDGSFYQEHDIDLLTDTRVVAIQPDEHTIQTADDRLYSYDRLLLATGATPIRPPIPGAYLPHVHCLRTVADCRGILAQDKTRRAVVVGTGFIGMEVAASLRQRGIEVDVVTQDQVPMGRIFGETLGVRLRGLHEKNGVTFHLEQTVTSIQPSSVTLSSGKELSADLVVLGVGVRPDTHLAELAGLQIDNGVVVDEFLRTSHKDIYAAGDIASWPSRRFGRRVRVEHWVVAQRLGQTAARNMLGENRTFDAVPFFWTQQFDLPVAYVGHAPEWDHIDVEGNPANADCVLAYRKDGRTLAVASIFRDRETLLAEAAMERGDEQELRTLVAPR